MNKINSISKDLPVVLCLQLQQAVSAGRQIDSAHICVKAPANSWTCSVLGLR